MKKVRKLPYKEDAIERGLAWVRGYYEDQLQFSDDLGEQIHLLRSMIKELHSNNLYSSDSQDGHHRATDRALAEALDLPLDQLPVLLMENVSTGLRRVTKRLYYPEAGKK